jgi:hypothetical protein
MVRRLGLPLLPFILVMSFTARTDCIAAQAVRWDYVKHPVRVSGNLPPVEDVDPSDPLLLVVAGRNVGGAFDGYGAQGSNPAAVRGWRNAALPTPQAPLIAEVDYGTPVAVSAFVHYFYVPGSRDLRFLSPAPSAFRQVRILARNDKGSEWRLTTTLKDLPADCPQVLPVGAAEPARYWRLEVLELVPGAEMLMSYEIETYTGGVPKIVPHRWDYPNLPAAFRARLGTHRPSIGPIRGALATAGNRPALRLWLEQGGRTAQGDLQLVIDKQAATLVSTGKDIWRADLPTGRIAIQSRLTPMGLLLDLTYVAKPEQPIKYQLATLRMSTPKTELYYIPAYAWSQQPVEVAPVNAANVQTRMATLGTGGMMLCLVPGTDRGRLGVAGGAVQNELLLGPEATPVLVTAVAGDWWEAYRFAVREIYDFREQAQTVPVSEIQYGISRYMLSDEVWEPTLGTVRSWPKHDPHTQLGAYVSDFYFRKGGFDAFALFGTPYSIPAYWARYIMNGDALARERCRSIVRWLCRSGVRMQDGPARGAFFSLQRFENGEAQMGKQGGWYLAPGILASHSTGAGLWSLLYYRTVSGDQDPEINRAIDEAAAWLLMTQTPEGGWPYAHDVEGKPLAKITVGGHVEDTRPSSGSIWNIWALWRLGKLTGERKYLEAAERGKQWYAREFIPGHHYHGYWEETGMGSREGYDAAIATVAFGEMGEKKLAIETAKDAIQWVFTRQIEPRDANNSAGLVAEQMGWAPASYCNPMLGLAGWTAWQASGDDFWQPFAMIPKAIGWWYQPDLGAMVWIPESLMAPIVGPVFESWWADWTIAQVGSLTLRWLVREVNRRAMGTSQLNEETLGGTVLGRQVQAWAPAGGWRPILPAHGQVNWLGFRSEDSLLLALFNHGTAGKVGLRLNSRNVNGVEGASTWPKAVHRFRNGHVVDEKWNGGDLLDIEPQGLVMLEWGYKR